MLCRLGKRKASERTDEPYQDPGHSKRAAVDAAVPDNTPGAAAGCPGAQSTGSFQDATIRGQGVDTRGHKRSADTQSASDYQGVATHSGMRQPEAKRPAPSFHEQSGEAHIGLALLCHFQAQSSTKSNDHVCTDAKLTLLSVQVLPQSLL